MNNVMVSDCGSSVVIPRWVFEGAKNSLDEASCLGLSPRFLDLLSAVPEEQAYEMLKPLLVAWLNYRPHTALERYQKKLVVAAKVTDCFDNNCRRTFKISPEFVRGILRLPMQDCMKYFTGLRKSWANGTREGGLEMEMINLEKEIDNRLVNETAERKENENE